MTATSTQTHIGDLQREVEKWVQHNFPHDTKETVVLGLTEEVGELCRAVLKRYQGIRGTTEEWTAEVEKETADAFLKLCHVAVVEGFDLYEVVMRRWDDISRRDWIANPKGHGLPKTTT